MLNLIFNVVLPVLLLICLLAIGFFILRSFRNRGRINSQAYNVGRTEANRASRANILWAALAFALLLLLLIVFAAGQIFIRTDQEPPVPTPEPTAELPTPLPETPTAEATSTVALPTATVALPTPTPELEATATPEALTATVTSGVGVWLRSAPSTNSDQIEWLLEGATLLVLDGRETAEDIEWQEVQTQAGVVGWVASDFIQINDTTAP